jgi:predicted PurR-regulated permease PerM
LSTPLPPSSSPTPSPPQGSPAWNNTIKTVVGVAIVAVVAFLFTRFRFIIGPIILAFMLAYLLHPIAANFSKLTRLNWQTSVKIIFVIVAATIIGLIVWLGFGIVQQAQNVYTIVQKFIQDLPTLVDSISKTEYTIGSFNFTLSQFNLGNLLNQVLPNLEAPLTRIGNLLTSLAGGTLGVLAWIAFSLIVAFFLLNETNTMSDAMVSIDIPGYHEDMHLLGIELRKIWNAFLRGQLTVVLMVVVVDTIVFLVFGVRFALGLALLAGIGRFVPYLGVWVVGLVIFLTAFFQDSNYFNLAQWQYASLMVILFVVIDQIFDQFVNPRVMGDALGIHPAALLITAIIAANLFGIVGLMLAAPVLATFLLIGRYAFQKMLDLEPFPMPRKPKKKSSRLIRWLEVKFHQLSDWLKKIFHL